MRKDSNWSNSQYSTQGLVNHKNESTSSSEAFYELPAWVEITISSWIAQCRRKKERNSKKDDTVVEDSYLSFNTKAYSQHYY